MSKCIAKRLLCFGLALAMPGCGREGSPDDDFEEASASSWTDNASAWLAFPTNEPSGWQPGWTWTEDELVIETGRGPRIIRLGAMYLVVHTRVVRPLRSRRPYRGVQVEPERGQVWSLWLEPDGHEGMTYRAGQYVWITVGDPPTQAEVQAVRDKCEGLADDVQALSTLVHALRGALVSVGVVKGAA